VRNGGGRLREEGKGYIEKHKCEHDNLYEQVETIVTEIYYSQWHLSLKSKFTHPVADFYLFANGS
jgi:hypothetical protein